MKIYDKAINAVRYLSACSITKAGSGHTGVCVGATDVLFTIFHDHLFFNPKDPNFENRDRLVLSAGHASPLYYALLHAFGYDISANDISSLRKYGSVTPGHPEVGVTDGVDCSTGPLGQGVANAVGLAIAAKYQADVFNTVSMQLFDNYTYCFAGDGCLSEGVAQEAISIAGKLKLNKLILLYDYNNTTLDASFTESSSENILQKFKAQGWNVLVCDGYNHSKISKTIEKAKKSDKPTIIIFKTIIGYKTKYENSNKAHGLVLSKEELFEYKKLLGIDYPDFNLPQDVISFCGEAVKRNQKKYDVWHENFFLFEKTHPELFRIYNQFSNPKGFDFAKLVQMLAKDDRLYSGRDANHIILNEVAKKYTNLIGGSADLASSTKVFLENSGYFGIDSYQARNIRFGVREHAMAGISNGMALYGSIVPFYSTFLSFSNYFYPSLRMASLMKLKEMIFLTHDSLLVGYDGPTHQPVEQISQLRLFPDIHVFRPANVVELLGCYEIAFNDHCPSVFILSKSEMCQENCEIRDIKFGAYKIKKTDKKPDVCLYSSGIDMKIALAVQKLLKEQNLNCEVVSVPCFDVLAKQTTLYLNEILDIDCPKKVVIESTNDNVWYKFLSNDILMINNTKYGKSGKGETVYQKYGFSEKQILKKINDYLKK